MNMKANDFSAALKVLQPGQTAICQRLRDAGFEVYLVGGLVRDFALGLSVHDLDLATSAQPHEVMALFARCIPTGLKHGTVTVVSEQGEPVEITTLRSEGVYSDGRHPDHVEYVTDIVQDLARRDFTINAMALAWPTARLIDPFAGMADLRQGLLRAVGEPSRRFQEDSLRLLRALRFVAKLGFEIEPKTLQAMSRCAPGIRQVAAERRRDELLRLLAGPDATKALTLALQSGILAASWPDFASVNVLQTQYKAVKNQSGHPFFCALKAMEQLPPEQFLLRLVLLLWVLGSTAADPEEGLAKNKKGLSSWPVLQNCFPGLSRTGRQKSADFSQSLLRDLRLSRRQHKLVSILLNGEAWSLLLRFDPSTRAFVDFDSISDGALRRFVIAAEGPENYGHFFSLIQAQLSAFSVVMDNFYTEDMGRIQRNLRHLEQGLKALLQDAALLSQRDLDIDGKALQQALGLRPGPKIGQLLHKLLQHVQDQPEHNQQDLLLQLASSLLEK